jgi:MFS superfamily sulfate permease-like transporter
MKQKDKATLIFSVVICVVIGVILADFIFGKQNTSQQIDVVPVISDNFPHPDPKYFNSSSIDPTQLIKIGTSTNQAPFTKN